LVSLAEAHEEAQIWRKLRHKGGDPIEARRAEKAEKRLAAAKAVSFRQCAERYIAAHRAGWKNSKHAAQWPSTLAAYGYPIFGELAVEAVDVALCHAIARTDLAYKTGDRRAACASASKPCSIGPRRGNSAKARTRRAGAAISKPCFRSRGKYAKSNIMLHCLTTRSAHLCRHYADRESNSRCRALRAAPRLCVPGSGMQSRQHNARDLQFGAGRHAS
jgi:hypothetical protein